MPMRAPGTPYLTSATALMTIVWHGPLTASSTSIWSRRASSSRLDCATTYAGSRRSYGRRSTTTIGPTRRASRRKSGAKPFDALRKRPSLSAIPLWRSFTPGSAPTRRCPRRRARAPHLLRERRRVVGHGNLWARRRSSRRTFEGFLELLPKEKDGLRLRHAPEVTNAVEKVGWTVVLAVLEP